ncbi:hypothetical protein [Catenuloplanes indicus]|uniref:Uncharacterized protein n=1 Tax=Catenuloplanes indicus TaxID=137267 RepID=A0AAE4B168_9ACTN|nr:hypothetical protein [Catenuloplanes indicus]MDQ0367563.1 hypothetical protein [Catenuloplanes indicus]
MLPEEPPPISAFRTRYEEERFYQDDRAAAEYAFALAVRLRSEGQIPEARGYAWECLKLIEALPPRSLDEAISDRQIIAGVPMPDYFHAGVVRSRLADLLGTD